MLDPPALWAYRRALSLGKHFTQRHGYKAVSRTDFVVVLVIFQINSFPQFKDLKSYSLPFNLPFQTGKYIAKLYCKYILEIMLYWKYTANYIGKYIAK